MGSPGSGGLDFGLGSIVWVRRRNGSWWPGKILAPDELLTTHLMSPRTGTPVKLLGREDASIDWYNLEKSKRVKTFRCGDFDDCIERAESSLGMPAKKREKYARREDAILHALELEKELLEKEHGGIVSSDFKSGKFSEPLQKKFVASSESLPFDNGNPGHAKPDESSTESDSSLKGAKLISFYRPQNKEETQLCRADDKSVSTSQMRGLQDIGLKASQGKQNCFPISSNGSQSPPADNHSYPAPSSGVSMVNTNCLDIKNIPNEERAKGIFVKRCDRRHDVLSPYESGDQTENICPAKRKIFHYLPSEFSDCLDCSESAPNQMENYLAEHDCEPPSSLMDENPCEFNEDEHSESSDTDDLDTESDGDANLLSGSSEADYRAHVGSEEHRKHKYVGSEELDELTALGDLSNLHDHDPSNAGVSKWQMKGKMDIGYLTKKLRLGGDVKGSSGFNDGTYMEDNGITFKQRVQEHDSNYNHINGFSNGLTESEMIDNDFRTPMTGYYNREYTSTSQAASNRQKWTGHCTMDWEDLGWEDHLPFPGYLYADEYLDSVFVSGHHIRTPLIEVDLKVQASYKKPHVPIISLMSKLDGKAIIGHPIPIEVLTDGFSETLFPTKNDIYKEAHYEDEEDRTLPPVWRTGRRTASTRVPRSHPSSALNTDESTDHRHHLGQERQPIFKQPKAWGFIQKKSSTSKDFTHISRPPLDRKLSRKLQKKVNSSSSQKTRTLSSIGIEQKIRRPKHHTDGFPLNGLIKTDSVPTALACIPVKLVFSRLYEAVGRPPAIASTVNHGAMIISMDSKTISLH